MMSRKCCITISGRTRLTGVVGNPIAHTLSPVMQNAAFAARGVDAVYVPLGVGPQSLRPLLRGLAGLNALGVNITIPYKHQALQLVDECSAAARRIGAVNTVVFRNGRLVGHNTDGLGFLASIRPHFRPRGQRAVLVGCGGAGHAIAVSLAEAGISDLTLIDPDAAQRRALLARLRDYGRLRLGHYAPGAAAARAQAAAAGLLVNASPLGMKPRDPLPLPADWIPRKCCVMDAVYGRGLTPWLRAAQAKGCRVVPGWHMLLHQGAESFRLWTSLRPPLQVMQKALESALRQG